MKKRIKNKLEKQRITSINTLIDLFTKHINLVCSMSLSREDVILNHIKNSKYTSKEFPIHLLKREIDFFENLHKRLESNTYYKVIDHNFDKNGKRLYIGDKVKVNKEYASDLNTYVWNFPEQIGHWYSLRDKELCFTYTPETQTYLIEFGKDVEKID